MWPICYYFSALETGPTEDSCMSTQKLGTNDTSCQINLTKFVSHTLSFESGLAETSVSFVVALHDESTGVESQRAE